MSGQIEGKVALVTGGGSGIGRATALVFAGEGAKVAIAEVDVKGGEETIQRIRDAGGEGISIKADVSQRSEVEMLIQKTVEKYGRLDCACNNAGIFGELAPTAECTEENWDKVININLKGVWLCTKYEIKQMLRQGGGAIVNIASGCAFVAELDRVAYIASKHGIVGVTKSAALEYATSGIRVNAVCPGLVRTELADGYFKAHPEDEVRSVAGIPIKRMAIPEEIAKAVVWLCTDAASYMVGHAMVIDGGVLIRA